MNVSKKPELLMPAGSLPVLKVAVIYGADAVYIGGEAFSLRANAHNFSLPEMKEGIEFAHAHGVKVYVTANILAHNEDLESARAYFNDLKGIGVDALIISDPGIFELAKEIRAALRDKEKYSDWANSSQIKALMQADIIMILAKHGYPPTPPEIYEKVYSDILEQAENFKKYSD